MRVIRSVSGDLTDPATLRQIRERGAEAWDAMQVRQFRPAQILGRRESAEVLRDLRLEYGSTAGIARELAPGHGPKSKEYKAARRAVERGLREERGIGPAYRERLARLAERARPGGFAARQLAGTRPPRSGVLRMRWHGGNVRIVSGPRVDDRVRDLQPTLDKAPTTWPALLSDPLESYYEGWGGPKDFTGTGTFTMEFVSDEPGEEDAPEEEEE